MADRRSMAIWTLGCLLAVGVGAAAGVTKGSTSGALFGLAGLVPGLIGAITDIHLKKKAQKKELERFKVPS